MELPPPEDHDHSPAEPQATPHFQRGTRAPVGVPSAETVDVFRNQVDHARHVDRRFGALTQLDRLRTQIDQVQQLLSYRAGPQRPALAGVLVEASTLAGWQALDRAALGQAWTHYERAKAAAREAGSPALLAHATAEQAFVLIDLDETTAAVDQLAHVRNIANGTATPLLRAWLAAAHGETLAAAGQADDAQRAFDTASGLLPADPVDPALPFLFLGDCHLDRWRGNALARVGAPDAIDQLTDALVYLPADFIRARTGLLVDLAYAHAAAGDRDAALALALAHTQQARRLATQIKSDRQQRRLNRLVLPSSGGA